LDGAVNKRDLSTGETRESAGRMLAPQAEPDGWTRTPARPGSKPERSEAATIFEMFKITRVQTHPAVNEIGGGS
jgi:hypothetical protein